MEVKTLPQAENGAIQSMRTPAEEKDEYRVKFASNVDQSECWNNYDNELKAISKVTGLNSQLVWVGIVVPSCIVSAIR